MTWNLDAEPRSMFTISNPKTEKGVKLGYLTAILHMAPAMLAGVGNMCPHSTAGCRTGCLNTAGHGGINLDAEGLNSVQVARIQRTRLFKRDRDLFMARLTHSIRSHVKRAWRLGRTPCVRLNGTTDLPWEKIAPELFTTFPDVTFYDYTKWPTEKRVTLPPNYSLVFSLAEDNDKRAAFALGCGRNVAAVFATSKGQPLPETYSLDGREYPIIDGDEHDLRFLDPTGVIVGLRAKGPAMRDTSGFVRTV